MSLALALLSFVLAASGPQTTTAQQQLSAENNTTESDDAWDSRMPGARYCQPWTADGATPAGAAGPRSCRAQCDLRASWCVAITWYPSYSKYSDQCYLFSECASTGKSSNSGQVWRRTDFQKALEANSFRIRYTKLLIYCSIFGSPLILSLLWTLHVRRLRRRGRTAACWGRVSLVRPPRVAPEQAAEQLAQTAIELLPSVTWDADVADVEIDDDEALCSLCLQNYERGDLVTLLPGCGHRFHKECVTRWLAEAQRGKQRSCPLCKGDPLAAMTPPATPSSSSRPSTPSASMPPARVAPAPPPAARPPPSLPPSPAAVPEAVSLAC